MTARSADGDLAEAVLTAEGDLVHVEIRATRPLPSSAAAALVAEAFDRASVGPARTVLVSVPATRPEVTAEVRRHLVAVDSHLAGATCLLRGRVAGLPAVQDPERTVPVQEES
ncbi:hypothetical protein ACWKWC_08440 [Geodermatophilus nigrescens]|uniref:hypothetical protein n=1 Tax=Geodermatophilus sp. FMUSA9-8 TaxID=3120155 RepID=UPI00300A9DF0